jgi:cytochrome c5
MQKTLLKAVFLTLAAIGISMDAYSADSNARNTTKDYHQARWDPIHFKPAIKTATNEQCLACHKEILERVPKTTSPAGVKAQDSTAWYQTLSTYTGQQDTFHRRHLSDEYAKKVMDLKCNTCHQGNDPREETPNSSANTQQGLTMRKMADPYVCAMCHGQHNFKKMGMPGPWPENSHTFGDSCLTCHAAIKLERHQGITFLKAANIETLAKEDTNVCYGCHGGRAWYRINFPYTEKKWPGWGDVPYGAESKYSKGGTAAPATAVKTAAVAAATVAPKGQGLSGEKAYQSICFSCHDTGIAESPKLGDKAAWAPRIAQGKDVLFNTVVTGKGAMPPRGASKLSDDELKAAIDYMISKAQ